MFKFKTMTKMKFVSRIGIGVTTLVISALLLFSYYGQQVGDFTIDVSQELYLESKMILSESVDFEKSNSRLVADPITQVYPIGIRGEPERVPLEILSAMEDNKNGSFNGINYFAYTFYAKNGGEKDFSYNLSMFVDDAAKHVDEALRVMVVKHHDTGGENRIINGVYAKKQSIQGPHPGLPEPGTIVFANNKAVLTENRYDFKVGQIDKYTVYMWLHGEDPDCVDIGDRAITNGFVKVTMKFSIISS